MPTPEVDAFGDPIEVGSQDPAALSDDTPEPEGEGSPKEEESERSKFIPRDRFDQVNNKAAQLEHELHALRSQAFQMAALLQQQQAAAGSQAGPELDADLRQRLKPYIDAEREYDRREISELRNIVGELSAVTEAQRGWSYIAENVPDWKTIGKDVIKYVETLPKKLQDACRYDPESMVHAANEVRKALRKGEEVDEEAVRESLKTRAHSEGSQAGIGGRRPQKDWMSMDSETFKREQAKLVAQKQRGYIPPDEGW